MKFAEGDKVVTDSIDIVTKSVVKYMIKSGRKLCTAESCTGGMISQTVTSVSGASEMFLGGACTYTEEIKMKLLNVKKETLFRRLCRGRKPNLFKSVVLPLQFTLP